MMIGSCATCIGYMGIVLITYFARVILFALDMQFAFQVESFTLMRSTIYWKVSLFFLYLVNGKPKYFPISLAIFMPVMFLILPFKIAGTFGEKKMEDLLILIFSPEELQN